MSDEVRKDNNGLEEAMSAKGRKCKEMILRIMQRAAARLLDEWKRKK